MILDFKACSIAHIGKQSGRKMLEEQGLPVPTEWRKMASAFVEGILLDRKILVIKIVIIIRIVIKTMIRIVI